MSPRFVFTRNAIVPPSLVGRAMRMTLVWIGFGLLVGAGLAPEGGLLGVVAGMVAGVLVLPGVGLVLGLIGGHWGDSLAGGVVGHLIGFSLAIVGGSSDVMTQTSVALVTGGILGATLSTVLLPMRKAAQGLLSLLAWQRA